jgi:hypothetical protein
MPMLPFSYLEEVSRWNRVRAAAAAALGRLRAKECVDLLAQHSVRDNYAELTVAACGALESVIPYLEESDSVALHIDTVPNLCRIALHSSVFRLDCFELVHALGKVGDGRAIPPVERLAKRGVTSAIRAEAERVLPILKERLRKEREASSLLRASLAPDSPTDILLRPAQDVGASDPQQLVRSVESD